MMDSFTRRQLVTRLAPALAFAALLPACGQDALPTLASVSGPQTVKSTPSIVAPLTLRIEDACDGLLYPAPSSAASDPYRRKGHGDGEELSFAQKVRGDALIIAVGKIAALLPPRWSSADGHRPQNPHWATSTLIFTPMRVQVEKVAKGNYLLPDLYVAISGGRIGEECASSSGFGAWPEVHVGDRHLFFFYPSNYYEPPPVPADDRFRYYGADPGYPIDSKGRIIIGPKYYSLGQPVDTPPRTLTVEDALSEIADLLAITHATPSR